MELNQNLRQVQTLSPQMLQAAKLLQMGTVDLREYLQEQILENPVLEYEEPSQSRQRNNNQILQKLEWLCSGDSQNRIYYQDDVRDMTDNLTNHAVINTEESLYDHLLAQIRFELLPRNLKVGVECVLQSLNSNGRLDEPTTDLAAHAGTNVETILEAISLVQSLDPAGVGARSLSECLELQLLRQGGNELPLVIVRNYLEDVGQNHYHHIAKKTGASQEQIRDACRLIQTLDPRPGSSYATRETTHYVIPDLMVVAVNNGFEVIPNDTYIPLLHISPFYQKLIQNSDDADVLGYLSKKMRHAQWVIQAVEQRRSTLLSCTQHIVEWQAEFFRSGSGYLRPMSLNNIAVGLGVHESTVSRAVQGKYLQCAYGVFPLKHFFSRALPISEGEMDISVEQAKAALCLLIEHENKKKPLSDQKLCNMLVKQGIQLSRRTVAKYRDEMNIPSTNGRKES